MGKNLLSHIDVQWAQYHLLKGPSFPCHSTMVSLYKSCDSVCFGQFLEALCHFIGLFSYPYDNTKCLNYYSFMSLESKTSNFVHLLQNNLGYSWTLTFVHKFQNRLVKFHKTSWILILIALNLQFNLGRVSFLKNSESSNL